MLITFLIKPASLELFKTPKIFKRVTNYFSGKSNELPQNEAKYNEVDVDKNYIEYFPGELKHLEGLKCINKLLNLKGVTEERISQLFTGEGTAKFDESTIPQKEIL